jgi:hypothetical protein
VCSAERIVHIHVSEFRETLAELLHFGRVGFGFVALLVLGGAFLLDVEAQVLEQDD